MRHLEAAKLFTKRAREIEYSNDAVAPNVQKEHDAYVTAAILASVAFLEARINELFSDICDNELWDIASGAEKNRKHLKQMFGFVPSKKTMEHIKQMETLLELKEKQFPVLKKYNLLLELAGKKQFDKGANPYQDADLLITLRNRLVHYKPEWIPIEGSHEVEKQLKSKFEPNRLMVKAKNPFFPNKCLGYGCASRESGNDFRITAFKHMPCCALLGLHLIGPFPWNFCNSHITTFLS